MELLDKYFDLQKEIYKYFGYVEDWRVIPLDDCRDMYWFVDKNEDRFVRYAKTKEDLVDEEKGNYYENEIYTQRFLPKWVYRGDKFTMVSVDTHTDGNQFLQIFDNDKEIEYVEE